MTTETTTTVEYYHILTEDFLIEENFNGCEIYAKAGLFLHSTAKPCKLESYKFNASYNLRRWNENLPRIPGDLIKLVKVTKTVTRTEEREDLDLEV